MNKMATQIESIVNAYKTLSKIPSVVGGRLNKTGSRVTAKWSVRNIDKGKNTSYLYSYHLDDKFNVIAESDFGIDISKEILSSVSPTETFRAVIREDKDSKDAKKQYLEVWQASRLEHSIDLTALDLHGDVYADSEFGCLNWSADESSVVYVAEKKLPKSEPYIKRKPAKDEKKNDGSGETPVAKGEEHIYRADWGEQLVGKHLSVIVVCRLHTETLTVLEGLPDGWCPGQVSFAPDGKGVVGVSWLAEPQRLGLIFCTNRPSYIFHLTLDGVLKKLSAEGLSVRSPRVSGREEKVVWMQRKEGGPHHSCHQLVVAGINDGKPSTLIDVVETEVQTANNVTFYGMFNQALPKKCFTNDGRIVFSTPQSTEVNTYVYDVDGARLVDISNRDVPGSCVVLDVSNDVILATCSNMTTPGQLFVAKLPAKGKEGDIKWVRISKEIQVPEVVRSSARECLHLEHKDSTDSVKSFSALYLAPKPVSGKKVPLILWLHGGPHSNFVDAFAIEAALYAMMGLASLRVNFRGSIGHGDANCRSLPGNIGVYDVKDSLLALSFVLERDDNIDPTRVALGGGSYGGFLATHLAGQRPDLFKCMVIRNPLIDLATKINYADNPDGCAVEAGFPFTEEGPVSEEQLLAMRRCSPLVHVHKVKAPTALMLGSGDKRVPFYQGLEYYRRLKANGVPARVYMYDDNHSLSSLPNEMDGLINGVAWFFEHMH